MKCFMEGLVLILCRVMAGGGGGGQGGGRLPSIIPRCVLKVQ